MLTHHWLVRPRGGERVLAALCELLPRAPIYTLVHDAAALGGEWPVIHTSWLQRFPGARRHYPKLLPLMNWAARRVRLPPVDLVVCSDAAIAKAMRTDPRSTLICYCHSPMRYAWDPPISIEYARTLPLPLRPLWPLVTRAVRRADFAAARRVDQFVANSRHVAERIRRWYGRESVVVHPPVDVPEEPFISPGRDSFYLCVGYHVPYKRLDLAIAACQKLGRRLVIIGDGPDVRRFEARRARDPQAALNVTLLGWQSPESIGDYYRRAAGLLFPGEEDFGIVPVEAMAHGCPVIAFGVGGATETVVPGVTGVLFQEPSATGLADAMLSAERMRFDPVAMHAHAGRFSKARFLAAMGRVCREVLERGGGGVRVSG
ncbi:D-inositol 3-phosphate glycosyltransferase [Phycisphaerae bacterium RAS1]|nr:D-inositol 3-phosphate glycosyltransferase [Phycisphaerae bacterium RAS1]